jgi:hypothetical protein
MNELKKKVSERNVCNYGTTILTNSRFLEQQREIQNKKWKLKQLILKNQKKEKSMQK